MINFIFLLIDLYNYFTSLTEEAAVFIVVCFIEVFCTELDLTEKSYSFAISD